MATRIEYEIKLRDYPDVVTIKELMLTIISLMHIYPTTTPIHCLHHVLFPLKKLS